MLTFNLAYAHACRRAAWPVAWLAAGAGWLAVVGALSVWAPGWIASAALALGGLALVPRLFPPVEATASPRPVTNRDLAVRMGMGALLTLAITAVAADLGPAWSGLVTTFPVITTVLAVSSAPRPGAGLHREPAARHGHRHGRVRGLLHRAVAGAARLGPPAGLRGVRAGCVVHAGAGQGHGGVAAAECAGIGIGLTRRRPTDLARAAAYDGRFNPRCVMSNPWLKKNPWLSMWMSGANTVASHARAQAKAETRRTVRPGHEGRGQLLDEAWFPNAAPPAAPKRKRRR